MVLTSWSVLIPMDEPLWTQSPRVGVSLVRTRTLGLVGLWGPLRGSLPLPLPFLPGWTWPQVDLDHERHFAWASGAKCWTVWLGYFHSG